MIKVNQHVVGLGPWIRHLDTQKNLAKITTPKRTMEQAFGK